MAITWKERAILAGACTWGTDAVDRPTVPHLIARTIPLTVADLPDKGAGWQSPGAVRPRGRDAGVTCDAGSGRRIGGRSAYAVRRPGRGLENSRPWRIEAFPSTTTTAARFGGHTEVDLNACHRVPSSHHQPGCFLQRPSGTLLRVIGACTIDFLIPAAQPFERFLKSPTRKTFVAADAIAPVEFAVHPLIAVGSPMLY